MNRRSDPSFQYKNLFDVLKIFLSMSILQEVDYNYPWAITDKTGAKKY